MKNRNYNHVINFIFALAFKLSFFIKSAKSMFKKLFKISVIISFLLFFMIIVKRMKNVFSFLKFISTLSRIFNECLAALVGIICHAFYQLVKGFIKKKTSNRLNHVLLKNQILNLYKNNKIAAFSHQLSLNK